MKKNLLIVMALLMGLAACKKEPDPTTGNDPTGEIAHKAYVLCEGLWGANDGSMSLIDYESGEIENYYFAHRNGRGLGDLAQDMAHYGGKLYIVVSGSNTVEVARANDGTSLRQIDFAGRSPRHLACVDGNVYVSCYNRYIYRIDTLTMAVTDSCKLSGLQPETMCSTGGRLYVVNSWDRDGSTYIYDHTLSEVDLASFSEVRKIEVGTNPFKAMVIDESHLLVGYLGNYGNLAGGLQIVDLTTGTLRELGIASSGFDIYNGSAYSYAFSYTTGRTQFSRIDLASWTVNPILESIPITLKQCYGIGVNPANGDLLVLDAQNFQAHGDVHCFAPDGTLRWSAEAGNGPNQIIF